MPRTLDGKEIKKYLWAYYTRTMIPGCIPVDRKERAIILDKTDERRFLVLVEVEAFSKDHAFKRLTENLYPFVERKEWEFIEELDDSHHIGKMGKYHPLEPNVFAAHPRIQ